MPNSKWVHRTALGILAMLMPAAQASAQPIGGTMGPTSRADVRISIRVMPRFTLRADWAARQSARDADIRPIKISSNIPALRYALVRQPAAAAEPTGSGRLLVLVVPD